MVEWYLLTKAQVNIYLIIITKKNLSYHLFSFVFLIVIQESSYMYMGLNKLADVMFVS